MKTLIALSLSALLLLAQEGPTVVIGGGPPNLAFTNVLIYSGGNLQYRCVAQSNPKPATPSSGAISAASNASPVSFTSTAHNFDTNALPTVIISGGTGNWTAINGTFTATITSANAFTIPVDSTSFGSLTGTITFITYAPRLNQLVWAIQKYIYDGSNNLIGSYWAGDPTVVGATSSAANKACASRASYSYQ